MKKKGDHHEGDRPGMSLNCQALFKKGRNSCYKLTNESIFRHCHNG